MNVGVIFGGKSCEHNISIITGIQVLGALSDKHTPIVIYIDETGVWWTGKPYGDIETFRKADNVRELCRKGVGKRVHLRPSCPWLFSESGKKLARLDVCVLANHGLNGEDGTLQGLLELSGIAYTGSNVRGSSVGMDKIVMKQVFAACKLPVLPYCYFDGEEYNGDLYSIVNRVKATLRFPIMVKPANLGSSIGISKARDWQELFASIRVALEWDSRVILENALENFTELNCACLYSGGQYSVSEIEKPIGWREFLTFEDKYMVKSVGGGREFPAKLDEARALEVKQLTVDAAKAIGISGVSRVDFMLDGEVLYVNEINTIPGAMANYLFDFDGGMNFTQLLEKCMAAAIERCANLKKLKYSYKAPSGLRISK